MPGSRLQVEVIEEGGQVKTVDPGFREACPGPLLNRLMPTGREADDPVLQRECWHGWSIPDGKTAIRLNRAT